MACDVRPAADSLDVLRRLREEPHGFDLFQALRRLECSFSDRPRWGESRHVQEDPIRLGQEPSMAFASSTLASYEPPAGGRPGRLLVYHPGLFGPQGPLPLHLTEFARDRLFNHRDRTFSSFADIFHHRLLSLFYRAWASAQPAVQYDRPDSDRFALFIGALMGLGPEGSTTRGSWKSRALLHHVGCFAAPTRNAEGLRNLLSDYFEARVEIESFVGHWIEMPAGARCRLGGGEGNASLGRTTTIGSRFWDCQHRFRILIGPVGYEDYCRLLPGSDGLRRLLVLARAFVGDELLWDLKLILKREEIPPLTLGGSGRLGWTTWARSRPAERDSSELVLDPTNAASTSSPSGT